MHSMEPRERQLALEVMSLAWMRLAENRAPTILAAVRAEAAALAERYSDVSVDFAEHVAAAAVWYLDRATRRVGDSERDGLTAAQRAVNLAHFESAASREEIERLFAVAAALDDEDV